MQNAARFVQSKSPLRPQIGIVLGSGLGGFAECLQGATRILYRDIPGLPVSTAIGHKGELVIGTLPGDRGSETALAIMSGRFHLYEGYTAQQTVSGVRLLNALGIRKLVLTNAAGGINPAFAEGGLVLVTDHINLQGMNPLVGPNDDSLGPRFPDMSEVYSKRLRALAKETAAEQGFGLGEGVYAALLGPSYETPAEIRYLRTIGADLVGMSTAAEAVFANYLGLEVLGVSCVTNIAAGLTSKKLSQDDVIETGSRVAAQFQEFLRNLLPKLI
ncbi:MAG: purine-nucleoside phosphorylase [Bryobacteraceae bacterium]